MSVPSNSPGITNVEATTKAKEIKKEGREGGRKERKNERHNKRRKKKITLINVLGIRSHCYTSGCIGRKANMHLACFHFPRA